MTQEEFFECRHATFNGNQGFWFPNGYMKPPVFNGIAIQFTD
jgi:hypothetical protein